MADLTAYPVIFRAPMILALLAGRKSQTRRLAWDVFRYPLDDWDKPWRKPTIWQKRLDKFQAGERPWLWVKETHWGCDFRETGDLPIVVYEERHHGKHYDHPGNIMVCANKFGHIPSIHMPKRASRLSLRVTDMRMERLQDISEEDAIAEGADPDSPLSAVSQFYDIWRDIHGHGAWAANPEVIVTEFGLRRKNIEAIHG